MRKMAAFTVLLIILAFLLSRQARADSFSGMVIDITAYSVSVKDDSGNVKIFQIRPVTTRADKNIHPQDRVNVAYQIIDGIQVATHITISKRYRQ